MKFSRMMQGALNARNLLNCSAISSSYEDAVHALNSLQSNAEYIRNRKLNQYATPNSLELMEKYLLRSGLTIGDLDKLSIIHVAGTKGKGSTCAFVESILRKHGFKTGLFSSPHLVSVCERFRISGQSIDEKEFAHHFWRLYNQLSDKKEQDNDMPPYFKFLTILMFHVFLRTNVDVAIVEVGIGGEFDCTNILRHPVCTGIASLALDHTQLLGETIEEIAFQKSGIFKSGSPAFTVPQLPQAMTVLKQRALEKNCPLTVVPDLQHYSWKNKVQPTLGIRNNVQKYNASLAIQLAQCWMKNFSKKSKINSARTEMLTDQCFEQHDKSKFCCPRIDAGLQNCRWPGRTQFLPGRTVDFYIDGAHTSESLESCVRWFTNLTQNTPGNKYLLFNTTGSRDSSGLLNILRGIKFEKVFFTPNVAGHTQNVDQENMNFPIINQMTRCQEHQKMWGSNSVVTNSVFHALELIKKDSYHDIRENISKPIVLATGSLHLVGALLCIVDPDLSMKTDF